MNQNTRQGVDFFAIKVEVLKIGESEPAVNFNAVEEPSGFRDEVKEEELTESEELRKAFWRQLQEEIEGKNRETARYALSARKPNTGPWYGQPTGNGDVKMRFWLHLKDEWIDTRLVFKDNTIYRELKEEQAAINDAFDDDVEWWDPGDDRQDAVLLIRRNADLDNRDRWDEFAQWFMQTGEQVIEVIGPRIQ